MSMQIFLFIIITVIIAMISLDMLIYFVISKRPKKRKQKVKNEDTAFQNEMEQEDDEIIVVEVEFKGYRGTYTYGVLQQNVYKGQYVLVLTRNGIRCAEVVTDSKAIKQGQLKIPPFLLENIICIADEVDLEYYS